MYDYSTVDELRLRFYTDLYDELTAVRQHEYPEEPAWTMLDSSEQLLLRKDDEELVEHVEDYTATLRTLGAGVPDQGDCRDRLDPRLPDDATAGIPAGDGAGTKRGLKYKPGRLIPKMIKLQDYVDRYSNEIIDADSPEDLKAAMQDAHWTTELEQQHDSWYEQLWEGLREGDPSIRD
ncbi:MAG: hypothetical protein SVU32_01960 [Candidatus Nanohaloarchaea archaeon]|nr:hypothetical protein [Candidatus Nanohaloarchaea archaeon]